ncbi:MAG TPA: ribosome maturation factor RimP [Myxococcales bacterium]|nr:ribosome maturation factor RimP [Myxococcales bacterium]
MLFRYSGLGRFPPSRKTRWVETGKADERPFFFCRIPTLRSSQEIAVGRAGRTTVVYRDIPKELKNCIEPVVVEHGLELMDVQTIRDRGQTVLRVTLDSAAADGRIQVDRLAQVSREVESSLEAAEIMDSEYRLEVSSPGLDRMLAREKDFAAACGGLVKVKTRRPLDGRRRFRGELLQFVDGVATVVVDGERMGIPFDDIEKANSVYSFSSADFQINGSA